jgi:TP901 family phage tail tape measure protein
MSETVDIRLSATDNFSSTMGKMLRSMDGLIGKHKGLAAAALATAAVVKGSISVYAEYEQQLAKVNTMLALGEEKFLPGYARAMKDLAGQTGQTTEKLSDAAFDILSASRGAEGAMAILAQTSRAAAAGVTDVKVATASALTTLNAFGLSNKEVTRVLDLQFAAVKRGRFTYEEYANTIGTLAATSSLAGQSIEAMNAAVATVTRGGISAERAIVAINGAMLAFIKPSKGAAEAAREYGIELNANTISGDNLGKTLEVLKGLRAEELAQIFVERRAFKAISVLVKDYAGFQRDLAEQYKSAGEMARAESKATNTLNFQTKRSVQIFKNAGRAIGEFLVPPLKEALKTINDSVTGVDEYLEKIDEVKRRTEGQIKGGVTHWTDLNEEIRVTQKEIDRLAKWAARPFAVQFLFEGALTPGQIDRTIKMLQARMKALRKVESDLLDTQINKRKELNERHKQNNKAFQESLRLQKEMAAFWKTQPIQGPRFNLQLMDAMLVAEKMRQEGTIKTSKMAAEEAAAEEELKRQIEEGNEAAEERARITAKRIEQAKDFNAVRQRGNEFRARIGPQEERPGLFGSTADMDIEKRNRDQSLRDQMKAADIVLQAKLRAKEAERIAHEEMTDGILVKDQDYWSAYSELMRASYDEQQTLATTAAEQTVAFIDRSFSALESELMKSKTTSKEVFQALEKEAKRGLIRTGLDFLKNELKSIFIVEKAKNTSEVKTAATAAALRKAAYIDQANKIAHTTFGHTFSAISAIPVFGPALAPGEATRARATVTGIMAGGVAHGGIDEIPQFADNQTFLLKAGERVVQPEANRDLTSFLKSFAGGDNSLSSQAGEASNVTVNVSLGIAEFKDLIIETVTQGTRDGDISIDGRSLINV